MSSVHVSQRDLFDRRNPSEKSRFNLTPPGNKKTADKVSAVINDPVILASL